MQRCVSRSVLSQYVDGEMSPAAAQRVRRHVETCPLCTRAVEGLRSVDAAIRREVESAGVPDLAGRVASDLEARGLLWTARVAAGKRRLFGEGVASGRASAMLAAAAAIVLVAFAGLDHLNRRSWERRTGPVLADARRVLVHLVLVDRTTQEQALAKARALARELALAERLASLGADADARRAGDLGDLSRAFADLAGEADLGPDLLARLEGGDLLRQTERLRESLALAR